MQCKNRPHIYIKKEKRQIKALSVLCPFLFLTFFVPGARCSRLASLIEVIGRGLIEVSLYPLISPACKDSFFVPPVVWCDFCGRNMWSTLVVPAVRALNFWLLPLSHLSLSHCLCFPGVLQVSISLKKVELSVGESKFFTCTGQISRSTSWSCVWHWCIWDRCMNAHNLRSADSSSRLFRLNGLNNVSCLSSIEY